MQANPARKANSPLRAFSPASTSDGGAGIQLMAGTKQAARAGPGQGRGETGSERCKRGAKSEIRPSSCRTASAPLHPWAVAQSRFSVGKDPASI
jgi:hypothetical protein